MNADHSSKDLTPKSPPLDPKLEEAFVYGSEKTVERPTRSEATYPAPQAKLPLSTRIRADLAQGLKRASLERKLEGQTPDTVQEILEDLLEPWLREQGYLK